MIFCELMRRRLYLSQSQTVDSAIKAELRGVPKLPGVVGDDGNMKCEVWHQVSFAQS
jgi:hypothetical protein